MLAIIPKPGHYVNAGLVREFRKLAASGLVIGKTSGHPDGWGIVAWRDSEPFYLGRQPTDASKDPRFEEACSEISKLRIESPLLAHLRKASKGAKILSNTHPFISGFWAFAHNGTIRRLNTKTKTDSEWFFSRLLEEIKTKGERPEKAIFRTVREVKALYPRTSSLTFLLSNGKETYAFRDFAKHERYYTMFYAETEEALIICQEKILGLDWHSIENGELFKADASGNYTLIELESTEQIPAPDAAKVQQTVELPSH
jgi:predicted glutamine amidotransferase